MTFVSRVPLFLEALEGSHFQSGHLVLTETQGKAKVVTQVLRKLLSLWLLAFLFLVFDD